jgi:hypothetical protein
MIVRTSGSSTPGRTCPLHYRYRPHVFASAPRAPFDDIEVLYVVGGLYGNELALDRILELFESERGRKRLVFNGDYHWFDVDAETFARIHRGVLSHTALRGNVETELANETMAEQDVGCGCGYPNWVDDDTVARSNRILCRLRGATTAAQRREMAALPMWLRVNMAGLRIAIVHGDAESLSGWGFAPELLNDPAHREKVRGWFAESSVDVFASTHTCRPVFQSLRVPGADERCWIFNNGAAGMPNFAGDHAGLLTRIAVSPHRELTSRFGVRQGDAFIDAVPIETDGTEVKRRFLTHWPPGSDAYLSYFSRIARGPSYELFEAVRVDA